MDKSKIIKPLYKSLGFAIGGALISYLAWGEILYLMPAAIFFAFLYGMADKRLDIFLLSGSYYLTGSRGLPEGFSNFFSSTFANGTGLWVVASVIFVITYTALWSQNPKRKAIGFIAATILMAIPPLGIVGWLSPLNATGMLLPNTGLLGLIFIFIIFFCAIGAGKKYRIYSAVATLLLCLNMTFIEVDYKAENWHGVQTDIEYKTGDEHFASTLAMANIAEAHIQRTDKENIVFPESALGNFKSDTLIFWQGYARLHNKNIFAGSSYEENGNSYNVVARITHRGELSVAYKQRMPVPMSMWRPFTNEGTEAGFINNPVVNENNNKVGYMICYEQLLVWPYVQSYIAGADIYVGVANDWWAKGTTIPHIQTNTLKSWSRLFGIEYVSSMNL